MTGDRAAKAYLGGLGVVLVFASVLLGFTVNRHTPELDVVLHGHAVALGPGFTRVAAVVSFVLSPGMAVLAVVSLGLRSVLARDPLVFKVTVLLGVSWSTITARYVYDRVRPVAYDLPSYPSGHVTAVTAVVFAGVVLCAHLARAHLRRAVVVAVLAVAATAASRVVLEMHWFTDTVGAVLATTGVGLLATLALRLLPAGVGSRRE
ncbi:phosphatase PAP2 family protein [Saccharothrix obliqua]|uniref:phosphatase PAP2 family protein n=1 Tax=Saccharothrix obliqua TaxID=2861747 RepID=UPI001C5CE005|nr:phosphatase PAP2 family protein [Saccharothrix obliqua]MBW4721693.1 phosphatase PAP2 family protein [Saccharothrix obliqua]